jgi:beta-xylosidase
MKKLQDIQIRDPFVLPVSAEGTYYLFGTTDTNCWGGQAIGFDCYRSRNLVDWEGPITAFRAPPGFWATHNFWAPEVHFYKGRFYMLATFAADRRYRGTQILVSEAPEGPYVALTERPVTPGHWQCLDGTLHLDEAGKPWIIFCHEWLQIHNGAVYAMQLSPDLKTAVAPPVFLFNASEAPWAYPSSWPDGETPQLPTYLSGPDLQDSYAFPVFVTDGPFLHRNADGTLLMLWSTLGRKGYTLGLARSTSGHVTGPWEQIAEPLWEDDGGHGMIFRAFDGQTYLSLHLPNDTPNERPCFVAIKECGDCIQILADPVKEIHDGC